MVDFSKMVLAPNMATFGRSVIITPVKSQPHAPAYEATGIWSVTQADIITEDGGVLSSRTLKLGIRLTDFAVLPKQGDKITTTVADLPLGWWQGDIDSSGDLDFEINDVQPDGQGGATFILKRTP